MSTEKRTLLFGGSFDPVHLGHEYIIRCALERTDYARLVVMPAARSNFKRMSRPASNADRLAMLHLALDGLDCGGKELVVSSWELDRGGISYSVDTCKAMYSLFPVKGRLGFLMGDDLVPDLASWHRYEDLVHLVDFVVFTRNGVHPQVPRGASMTFIDVKAYEASSSAVRSGALDELNPSVRNYVIGHGLYGTGEDCQGN